MILTFRLPRGNSSSTVQSLSCRLTSLYSLLSLLPYKMFQQYSQSYIGRVELSAVNGNQDQQFKSISFRLTSLHYSTEQLITQTKMFAKLCSSNRVTKCTNTHLSFYEHRTWFHLGRMMSNMKANAITNHIFSSSASNALLVMWNWMLPTWFVKKSRQNAL